MIIYKKRNLIMELLNSKSILDCNEQETEQHNQECSTIIENLHKYNDHD